MVTRSSQKAFAMLSPAGWYWKCSVRFLKLVWICALHTLVSHTHVSCVALCVVCTHCVTRACIEHTRIVCCTLHMCTGCRTCMCGVCSFALAHALTLQKWSCPLAQLSPPILLALDVHVEHPQVVVRRALGHSSGSPNSMRALFQVWAFFLQDKTIPATVHKMPSVGLKKSHVGNWNSSPCSVINTLLLGPGERFSLGRWWWVTESSWKELDSPRWRERLCQTRKHQDMNIWCRASWGAHSPCIGNTCKSLTEQSLHWCPKGHQSDTRAKAGRDPGTLSFLH